MKLSAKWSTVSVLSALALGTAAFGFAGCTVTSGTIDDTGGTVRPDSGGGGGGDADTDGGTDAAAPTCEVPAQTAPLVSSACQLCLEDNCCDELKTCFDGSGGEVDCNVYAECISTCVSGDPSEAEACVEECQDAADPSIVTAYNNLIQCGGENPTCAETCGITFDE